jgi:hypothetical protein
VSLRGAFSARGPAALRRKGLIRKHARHKSVVTKAPVSGIVTAIHDATGTMMAFPADVPGHREKG